MDRYDPLLTDQQIENGIDWTSRSANARAMTPHAVRAFYEDQITRDRALIQTLMGKADSVIKRWDSPKWKWDQRTELDAGRAFDGLRQACVRCRLFCISGH